jgi:hypothetical protein
MASTTIPEPVAETRPPAESESLYEVVNGRRVELPPMGARPTHIANILGRRLGTFAEDHGLGNVEVEMLFLLDEA